MADLIWKDDTSQGRKANRLPFCIHFPLALKLPSGVEGRYSEMEKPLLRALMREI